MKNLKKLSSIIESILFVSGKAVSIKQLVEKLQIEEEDILSAVKFLQQEYENREFCGMQLLYFNQKLQLASNPLYQEYITTVLNPIKEKEFTKTLLECIAIIAYKQPITKGEIDALRGINSDYAISSLLELKFIEPVGKKNAIGRPILYGTTDLFLKRFQLTSLADLPDYVALMEKIAQRNVKEQENNYLYADHVYQEERMDNQLKNEKEKDITVTTLAKEMTACNKDGHNIIAEIDGVFEEELPSFLAHLEEEEDLIKIE